MKPLLFKKRDYHSKSLSSDRKEPILRKSMPALDLDSDAQKKTVQYSNTGKKGTEVKRTGLEIFDAIPGEGSSSGRNKKADDEEKTEKPRGLSLSRSGGSKRNDDERFRILRSSGKRNSQSQSGEPFEQCSSDEERPKFVVKSSPRFKKKQDIIRKEELFGTRPIDKRLSRSLSSDDSIRPRIELPAPVQIIISEPVQATSVEAGPTIG